MNRIVVVSSCLIALTVLAGASWGQIVVNEIMADPASDWDGDSTYSYKGDEWIEIYNAGVETVDLAAYWVGDSDSTLLYNFSGTLRARKHVVVYGSQVESWQRANGLSAVGLRLNNSGDTVMLWIVSQGAALSSGDEAGGSAALPVLVDRYEYQNHEAEDDRSTGLFPDGADSRALFDALNPYTGSQEPEGTGCLPTPGVRNECPTPVERNSWGPVKSLYR